VCKIIFTYSVANDIHYVKDANQQIKFKNRIGRKLKSISPRLSKLAQNFGKVAGVKPTTQNRTCATKNRAIDINRPQDVEVDLRERLKGQWIRVVHIDETPAASRGRRENCAESIKNSIRNRVCSRTHTIVSSCVTSTPPRRSCPADFPPSAAPRESCNYGDPSPFTLPPAAPEATRWSPSSGWFLPISMPDYPWSSISLFIFLLPIRLLVIITILSALINSNIIEIFVATIDKGVFSLRINERKYFLLKENRMYFLILIIFFDYWCYIRKL